VKAAMTYVDPRNTLLLMRVHAGRHGIQGVQA